MHSSGGWHPAGQAYTGYGLRSTGVYGLRSALLRQLILRRELRFLRDVYNVELKNGTNLYMWRAIKVFLF
jgi:hypothetical protein